MKKKFPYSMESESDASSDGEQISEAFFKKINTDGNKEINDEDNKNIDNEKKDKTEIDKVQMLQKRYEWLNGQLPIEVRPSGIEDKDSITNNNMHITWLSKNMKKVEVKYNGKIYKKLAGPFREMYLAYNKNPNEDVQLDDEDERKTKKRKTRNLTFWEDVDCHVRQFISEPHDTEESNPRKWNNITRVIPLEIHTSLNPIPNDKNDKPPDNIKTSRGRKRKIETDVVKNKSDVINKNDNSDRKRIYLDSSDIKNLDDRMHSLEHQLKKIYNMASKIYQKIPDNFPSK